MHEFKAIIRANWDNEAEVWVATSDNVPGLITEASTAGELVEKLKVMIPELLVENGVIPDCKSTQIPFHLHSEREEDFLAQCAC